MSTKTKVPTPKKSVQVLTDKMYKLTKNIAPMSYMLSSKHTKRKPLLYFDETEGINKPLRYAKNQKSPFEDEQDGNAILEPIIFEDGFLHVPKTNPVLQEFLHYHPENGYIFVEVNEEKNAQEDLEIFNVELDALVAVKEMSIERLEQVARAVLGLNVDKMTSAELKRDVMVYARRDPWQFLEVINDPILRLQALSATLFDNNLLVVKNKKHVYFNTKTNKAKMLTIPFGESRDFIVASFFQSDDGIEALKVLEKLLKAK